MKKVLLMVLIVSGVQNIICMVPAGQPEEKFLDALEKNDVEAARQLVSQVGETTVKKAFWDALKAKNLKKIETILDISNISIDLVDTNKNTPLLLALKDLLQEVKNENIQDIENVKKIVDIIKVILARGPNPSKPNDAWQAPVNLAQDIVNAAQKIVADKVKEDIFKLLHEAQIISSFKEGQNQYDLYHAIVMQKFDDVKKVPLHFLKFDIQGSRNPLMIAVQNRNLEIVEYLLQKGANPNAEVIVSGNEGVPLTSPILSGNIAMVKLLVSHGANINYQMPHSGMSTFLMVVVDNPMLVGMAEELLALGANPLLKNLNGQTARDIAIKKLETSEVKGNEDLAKRYKELITLLEEKEKDFSRIEPIITQPSQLSFAVQNLTRTLQALQVKIIGG